LVADLYENLSWLKQAPPDVRISIKGADQSPDPGPAIQRLASYAMSADQLASLGKTIRKLQHGGRSLAPLEPFGLGMIGTGTLNSIEAPLVAAAARHGFSLDCRRGEYDQILQQAVSPDSIINRANLDAVLIAIDYRSLPLRCQIGQETEAVATARRALAFIASVTDGIKRHSRAVPIVQTIVPPAEPLFGALDRSVPGSAFDLVTRLNAMLAETYRGEAGVLFDVARLAETVGAANWHDPTLWNLSKIPFANTYLPLYVDHVARLIAAFRGKSRRCLVLDCDNTLWGGVIGDDGLDGIQLAQGDATGEAFLSLQRYALALRDRGIVLTVSSKNDDGVARRVFREHPEMLLREKHIAVFQANWQDKATNIQAIAEELSLGLDAFVFVDDNPVERELVRRSLPKVAVPELPEDPALFARTLAAAGYFDAVLFSDEDLTRAEQYQANADRAILRSSVGDLDAYLDSLDMEVTFRPFDATNRARITQLINKSNQFNLTTRRYTEAEIAAVEGDPTVFTLQARLTDAFGDNGMISVVICRQEADDAWRIDTWLMSCRVLMRGVEQAVLNELMRTSRSLGIRRLIGVYRPTDRNQMVRDHYEKLGFESLGDRDDGSTEWVLDTARPPPALRMRVVGGLIEAEARA
jgi:FkbH-like protein